MNLEFRWFQKDDFSEYAGWFSDPELNRWLGPMDEEWLAAVLKEAETDGETWAVFRSVELVAVLETAFHPEQRNLAAITGLAVKPQRKRQGLGKAALAQVLHLHRCRGIRRHLAYVKVDNFAARRCLERVGFSLNQPSKEGFLSYCTGVA